MAELRCEPRSRVTPESTDLQVVRRNVASRGGEDGLIEGVF